MSGDLPIGKAVRNLQVAGRITLAALGLAIAADVVELVRAFGARDLGATGTAHLVIFILAAAAFISWSRIAYGITRSMNSGGGESIEVIDAIRRAVDIAAALLALVVVRAITARQRAGLESGETNAPPGSTLQVVAGPTIRRDA